MISESGPELPQPQENQPRNSLRSFLVELLQTVVLALVLYFLIDSVLARVRVENVSMEPTLQPGEFILVNKLAYRLGNVSNGDVVIFHYPLNPSEDYIKRVIGIPGDVVTVQNHQVTVNGTVLDEPYIMAPPNYNNTWTVPAGQIFVLGDNRNSSSDSHNWGFVPLENLVGKALVVYWPLDQMKILTHPNVVNAAN
ncbi:signal peptidase I, bacterial type [Longilinea arvoryzae]|uniref:Signal peptidase I n=1 Tax=Longilinea arvoryzae TaxID=360412 RepID=A0A0S7BEM0_9CHLR|nr:signal peptidase I [Longilinea arvoryzae]GAP13913.1 signal peptidase I, bacterial type [Longilinea arvoryzae]